MRRENIHVSAYVSSTVTSLAESPEWVENVIRDALGEKVFSKGECNAIIGEAKNLILRLGGGERYHALTCFFDIITNSLQKVR